MGCLSPAARMPRCVGEPDPGEGRGGRDRVGRTGPDAQGAGDPCPRNAVPRRGTGTDHPDDPARRLAEQGVQLVQLVYADVLGVQKGLTLPVTQAAAAWHGGVRADGASLEELIRVEEGQMQLRAGGDQVFILPWEPAGGRVAMVPAGIFTPGRAPLRRLPAGAVAGGGPPARPARGGGGTGLRAPRSRGTPARR